jgi:hypothetical protein
MRLRVKDTVLSLLSTTTVFGTPRDVTLSELAIESFYPADTATAAFLGMERRVTAVPSGEAAIRSDGRRGVDHDSV